MSFKTIFALFFLVNIIIFIILIVVERKKPEKTIAWLLLFLIFPPLGLISYIFLGRNWKKHKLHETTNIKIEQLVQEAISKIKNFEYCSLIELLSKNSESPLFKNNSITIFKDGNEKFKHLKKELLDAKHHIHLEYYIVKSDKLGNEIKNILIEKAKKGVEVRFIMDRVGSIGIKKSYIKELKDNGVDVVQYSYFLAPLLKRINTQINYRNHRKIVVIDGEVGFIGGINIGDEYLGKGKLGYWRDTHIMVKGDFVMGLQAVFMDDFATIKSVNDEFFTYGSDFKAYFPKPKKYDEKVMQLVKSGPDSQFQAIMQAVFKMITLAKKHIYITTPYFVPNDSIMNALKVASLSGVDVRILFPGRYDHLVVYYASRTYLEELINYGIKIYFYNKESFVHAKTIMVDSEICTVGTANMDIRSYELNYEINAVIYDEETTEQLENMFFEDLKNSKRISKEDFDNRTLKVRMLEGIARIFSALL